ncbi:MAG TPA: response regulator [Thermoanaerobaculia bacterium]|nr:response regulator [Thermoanaerobaculia bacterium]
MSEERVKLLAVDDNPAKLLSLGALLGELGQEVLTAPSGREALRLMLQHEFAVVLLDVHMPTMDGFETAALIRQRKASEHTPIIFVTSYPDDTHAERGYRLGAVDYILAPVDPDVLKAKVSVFVELYRKSAQVRAQASALERRASQLQQLTEASLAINSALSPGETLQVVADFARTILRARQAVAVAAPEEKWSDARRAISIDPDASAPGERVIVRDGAALVSLLSVLSGPAQRPRGPEPSRWDDFLVESRPGREGWLAAPLTGRDGRPFGLLHVLDRAEGDFGPDDASALTQLAQMSSIAIENAINAEAREANRMKDEFLTTLSHELRTPLAAIVGWTRLLRTGRLDAPRTVQALEVIERNVASQAKLIDDLLDVSRIITGKLRLSVRRGSLANVVAAAMDSMRPAADGKQIELRFENAVPAGEDETVGDPDRLQQIFWNLISNSIKFTPAHGRVVIALRRGDGGYEVEVTDTGQGMSPDFLRHAFDRFRQADSSVTRAHGGLGIGLAIARHLTELHGGSISAESAGPGLGSRFLIRLPAVALGVDYAPGPEPETFPTPAAAAVPLIAGVRVLLVEDQWDSRELMAEILRSAGCEVEVAGSVAEALERLRAAVPDVLVSDIGMPGEDGYSLLRRIRQSPAPLSALPAIAVSAYAREEDRIRALSAGFQMHLAKPFEPAELLATVARAAGERPAPARGGRMGDPLHVLVIEDDPDLGEGLKRLLELSGYEVELAGDGPSGIERALERRPLVALVDLGLPGLDGYGVARKLRSLVPREEMSLVAISGVSGPEDIGKAVASGFDDYIAKPVSFDRLDTLLGSRLASVRRPDEKGSGL